MRSIFAAFIVTVAANSASAQITVQQPVIGTIGGNFSVIVPDRGATLLGGVSRAGDSRSSVGLPFLRGSSRGQFRSNRSMWAHSRIIDLREMDQMILEAADNGTRPDFADKNATPRIGIAFTELPSQRMPAIRENNRSSRSAISAIDAALNSRPSTQTPIFASSSALRSSSGTSSSPTAAKPVSRAFNPARNYQLGLEAERSGRVGLAKLFYRTAVQHGSVLARHRLEQLSQQAQSVAAK